MCKSSFIRMPKRKRWSKGRHYSTKRYRSAATSIQKAWRTKLRRRRGNLNTRTTLANRKAIKQLVKSRETKWIDSVQGVAPTYYSGQWINSTQVAYNGLDTSTPATPVSLRVLRGITQGTPSTHKTRIGAWIQVKSVTVHARFKPPLGLPATENYNRMRIYMLLDTEPNAMTPVTGTPQLPTMALLKDQTTTSDNFMNYFSPVMTGKEGRFKVLGVKTAYVGYVSAAGTAGTYTGFPNEVAMTFNFGRGYKIQYAEGTTTPMNQELVLVCHSDSRVAPHPYVELKCKVRFYDA